MQIAPALVPLLVTLPLLGAAIALIAGRHRRTQVVVSVTTLTVVCVIAAILLYVVDTSNQAIAVSVGGWPIPFGIVLYVDRLAALLTLWRIVIGPSILDRAVASDVLLTLVMCVLGAEMAINHHTRTLPVLLIIAAVGVFGSISIARFVARRDQDR